MGDDMLVIMYKILLNKSTRSKNVTKHTFRTKKSPLGNKAIENKNQLCYTLEMTKIRKDKGGKKCWQSN